MIKDFTVVEYGDEYHYYSFVDCGETFWAMTVNGEAMSAVRITGKVTRQTVINAFK